MLLELCVRSRVLRGSVLAMLGCSRLQLRMTIICYPCLSMSKADMLCRLLALADANAGSQCGMLLAVVGLPCRALFIKWKCKAGWCVQSALEGIRIERGTTPCLASLKSFYERCAGFWGSCVCNKPGVTSLSHLLLKYHCISRSHVASLVTKCE